MHVCQSPSDCFGIPQIASKCEHVFLCSASFLKACQILMATDTSVALAVIEVC